MPPFPSSDTILYRPMSKVPGRNRPSLVKPLGELRGVGEGSETVAPIAASEPEAKEAPQEGQNRAVSETSVSQDLHLTIKVSVILSIFYPSPVNNRLPDNNRLRSRLTTTNQVFCQGIRPRLTR
jgi:hypothetical protein